MPNILIIEDEPSIAIPLRDMLAHDNGTPVIAGTLEDAKNELGKPYDAILLDLNLPYNDGTSKGMATMEIVSMLADPQSIVVFTGYEEQAEDVRTKWPDTPVIMKPYAVEAVREVLYIVATEVMATGILHEGGS